MKIQIGKQLRIGLLAAMTVSASLGLAPLQIAQATAPLVKTSAPGYYRMMLGDFEVTALSDGTADLPMDKLLTNTTPAKVNMALARSFLKAPVETSVNSYLVNTGSKLVLIDIGAAKLFGPTLSNLLANLKAAGYQPEQIDEIYITHMHADHVSGLMDGDKMAFPNATVRADKRDVDYWLSQTNLDKAAPVAMYGHTAYLVESKGQKLLLWGDLVHAAAVQFDDPSVTIKFDGDARSAALQRKRAFADAARNGYLVGSSHISFPGIGHVRANGKGYAWVPVNYAVVR